MPQEKMLKFGAMAEANGISKKALRVYQGKGLIDPAYIDRISGYQYFNIAQSAQLDLVASLQSIGLSLDEIREIGEKKDAQYLRTRIDAAIADIEDRQRELTATRESAESLRANCDLFLSHPPCDVVLQEDIAPFPILEFSIPRDEPTLLDRETYSAAEQWEWIVHFVKRTIAERGWPSRLFRNVGYLVAPNELDDPYAWQRRAFVPASPASPESLESAQSIAGGPHLVIYRDIGYNEDGDGFDFLMIQKLWAHAREQGLSVAGDLFVEDIFPFARYFGTDEGLLHRYCLPVKSTPVSATSRECAR
ncbi:MerR family transcriptional regulator [Adlercreutzia sp. R25]|uniref:MerR family transcriptional regulator n=1 Tax=Adlercreutzia shanghongiae TaxID=3111773 RepID=A0ABU6IYZ7_9ACTN|nr:MULTISPECIES: MerR family transcriptional regulator [unclassified Adlercreutzia]MEC4271892.1 MerR family transcriptional regulator [Adlercreutzia sp. R25]MEC4294890.1 MerR family transcriptional regulator [Adlercreutzia sp. R22]